MMARRFIGRVIVRVIVGDPEEARAQHQSCEYGNTQTKGSAIGQTRRRDIPTCGPTLQHCTSSYHATRSGVKVAGLVNDAADPSTGASPDEIIFLPTYSKRRHVYRM